MHHFADNINLLYSHKSLRDRQQITSVMLSGFCRLSKDTMLMDNVKLNGITTKIN